MSFIEFRNVDKIYKTGDVEVAALRDVGFRIEKGELCVILGQSGAGKTTLLNILGGMDHLTHGDVFVDGREVSRFNSRQLADYRRNDVGFVFQFYNLIPNLTALENVEMASQLVKDSFECNEILDLVGLTARRDNFPAQLSGGEQQRVAIARAIAKKPKLLLCDEPTGALDYETGKSILKLLQDLARRQGITVIIITHNSALSPMADRVIRVKNGEILSNVINTDPVDIDQIEW
ncbi:MAG: ABC transporter ATP-binding protein [Clostridiales bacterium]|nr:ABC transporter ATP-binding protein [Clostridiales bacterium]